MIRPGSPIARALAGAEAPDGCALASTPRRAWRAYLRRWRARAAVGLPYLGPDSATMVAVRLVDLGDGFYRAIYSAPVRVGRAR